MTISICIIISFLIKKKKNIDEEFLCLIFLMMRINSCFWNLGCQNLNWDIKNTALYIIPTFLTIYRDVYTQYRLILIQNFFLYFIFLYVYIHSNYCFLYISRHLFLSRFKHNVFRQVIFVEIKKLKFIIFKTLGASYCSMENGTVR